MPIINTSAERRQDLPFYQYQTDESSSSSISSGLTIQRSASTGPRRPSQPSLAAPRDSDLPPSSYSTNISKSGTTPDGRRRSSIHRRANSITGLRDGIGNLNRWSQSTSSSKGSAAHGPASNFSRRMSFGGAGVLASGGSGQPQGPSLVNTAVKSTTSSNKLHKSRPTAEDSFAKSSQSGRALTAPSDLAKSQLPSLILPSLPTRSDSDTFFTASTSTPLGSGNTSILAYATPPDYFGKTWEESVSRDSPQTKSSVQANSPYEYNSPVGGSYAQFQSNSSHSKGQRQETDPSTNSGHSRHRSQATKGSSGTTSSDKSKDRASKQPSQKAMLSKALQKANTAVLLDNAQNFEGAMQAYSEACNLLQQVMSRSSGDDDKRKLEAIRNTYTTRITELEKIAPHLFDDGKALPARPESYKGDSLPIDYDEEAIVQTAVAARIIPDDQFIPEYQQKQLLTSQLPTRRESLLPSALGPLQGGFGARPMDPRSQAGYAARDRTPGATNLMSLMDGNYAPPPLSPRRSPVRNSEGTSSGNNTVENSDGTNATPSTTDTRRHERVPSTESMSWLDTIDESGGSTASSVHSTTSSFKVRRKHIRAASGATEAEFDAALDAAVEAAYDDGFEPMEQTMQSALTDSHEDDDVIFNVKRKVELAREKVRQTERETNIQYARDRDRMRRLQEERHRDQSFNRDDGNDSEEEERMLEEMTRGYVMDDFEFGLPTKSALPRESDSSGFSGRTWNSSIGSNPNTGSTNLSTVTENTPEMPTLVSRTGPPGHPPPLHALPAAPNHPPNQIPSKSAAQSDGSSAGQSVRNRRLSGQNPKQLKIETVTKTPDSSGTFTMPPSLPPPQIPVPLPGTTRTTDASIPRSAALQSFQRPPVPNLSRQTSSPFPGPTTVDTMPPPTPTVPQNFGDDGENIPRSGSPMRAPSRSDLKMNFSSSSLKNLKNRNLVVSNFDDTSDASPNTPLTSQFGSNTGRLPAMPALPTPIAAAFRDKMSGPATGGLYLFDSDLSAPDSPGDGGPSSPTAPIPLEPCPMEFLLRPFWLMRALYQTIAHPRGGYLSKKLFVPRDVWRVKGVKIKAVEDKIANCDFLTAALQKLAKVDTCDADSVLDEMQALESVLENVRITLSKKLGNEVGTQGPGMLFKDTTGGVETESGATSSKTPSSSTKSSFSWRRLRSKNSGIGLANAYTATKATATTEVAKDSLTSSSLPMTSLTNIRFAKRDIASVQFSGPNANYMAALARLFDAAQVIDQIARQVEDPGLRHVDKTQVGLELSTRIAAEFFGFYICRFVLNDVTLLLDKFIKRGSEWVVV